MLRRIEFKLIYTMPVFDHVDGEGWDVYKDVVTGCRWHGIASLSNTWEHMKGLTPMFSETGHCWFTEQGWEKFSPGILTAVSILEKEIRILECEDDSSYTHRDEYQVVIEETND